MAADVAKLTEGLDKVYKSFAILEVQLDHNEVKGLSRAALQHVEQKFQQQLQRARAAFLQEFRNHSVVVEHEVKRIREELTEVMEEKYGEKIEELREQALESSKVIQRHKEEITQLKNLTSAQEAYLTAVRHYRGKEDNRELREEVDSLRKQLKEVEKKKGELAHQLSCRDELVAQLGTELSALEGELEKQAGDFVQERRGLDESTKSLRVELQEQQARFKETLREYKEHFEAYRAKTTAELQLQEVLLNRRAEALELMEEERQRHMKAVTKPTRRIGPADGGDGGTEEEDAALEERCEPYQLEKKTRRYRVDELGMDTSWRDYQVSDLQLLPPARKPHQQQRKIRAERTRKAAVGPNAPVATDNLTPRQQH